MAIYGNYMSEYLKQHTQTIKKCSSITNKIKQNPISKKCLVMPGYISPIHQVVFFRRGEMFSSFPSLFCYYNVNEMVNIRINLSEFP